MVPFIKVIDGVSRYIDEEIINKINGLNKWVIGVAVETVLKRSASIFNNLKSHPMIKAMEIVNEKDEIDIELIYRELKKQAQKSAVTMDIPLVGALTLNEQDVDKLYGIIMGG